MSSMSLDACDGKEKEKETDIAPNKSHGTHQKWLWSESPSIDADENTSTEVNNRNVNNSGFVLSGIYDTDNNANVATANNNSSNSDKPWSSTTIHNDNNDTSNHNNDSIDTSTNSSNDTTNPPFTLVADTSSAATTSFSAKDTDTNTNTSINNSNQQQTDTNTPINNSGWTPPSSDTTNTTDTNTNTLNTTTNVGGLAPQSSSTTPNTTTNTTNTNTTNDNTNNGGGWVPVPPTTNQQETDTNTNTPNNQQASNTNTNTNNINEWTLPSLNTTNTTDTDTNTNTNTTTSFGWAPPSNATTTANGWMPPSNPSDTNTNNDGGWTPLSSDTNNQQPTNTNNGWTFTSNTSDTNNNDPFASAFQTIEIDNDPFDTFRQNQANNNNTTTTTTDTITATNNAPTQQSPPQTPANTNNNSNINSNTNIDTDTDTNTNQVTQPVIDETQIDQAGMAAFYASFAEQTKDQWCCQGCSHYNPFTINICESCLHQASHAPTTPTPNPTLNHHPDQEEKNNHNHNAQTFEYHDILTENQEILQYDSLYHPTPKYFPYDHDEKEQELQQEGPEAWVQFDDISDHAYQPQPTMSDTDKQVRVYRECKNRRTRCQQQINGINSTSDKKRKIRAEEILIAIAGDGSVSGQLGVGNGSVTRIRNNISPFPFIMSSLLPKKKDIVMTATGIMSTAVVTADNEIYVWGLNDKSELTINPKNIHEVDVGDDDDQLSPSEAWPRLYQYYYDKITQIYTEHNPAKLEEKKGDVIVFVDQLLVKRKTGKLIMTYGDNMETKEGQLGNEELIQQIVQQFSDKYKSKSKKKKVIYREEVDIEEAAQDMHTLYNRICIKFNIVNAETVPFIPKASEQEVRDRRDRKLNPYKYLKQEDMAADVDSDSDDGDTKVQLTVQDSENKPSLRRTDVKMDDNAYECDSEYEYEQKKDTRTEDNFQGALSCSYWTPANITLPYKMVIKSVSLGGTHMVVLDNIGQVWSSGTFMNDGVLGHHWDAERKLIVRYQRTLHRISNIESHDDGLYSQSKNKSLPEIAKIASGANHFLMLDTSGHIWTMGVTKLGQRWCLRNIKKYLCPQRISVINHNKAMRPKSRKNAIKFRDIACGNHHNVAISKDEGDLYSWGQNIWIQCGHPPPKCGYGNVVDQPRWVPFFKSKLNINDSEEEDVVTAYEDYPKVKQVVAGEHMTVALDESGRVWTCGRNACGALGRKTHWGGEKDYGIHGIVKTEVKPDMMRCVEDLANVCIDWIGCGSVFWFGHDKHTGNVYTFGDSSSGRAGIGQWKYSRGRTVFDKYNMDLSKYEITSANGGSDHSVFTIQRRAPALSRRHSSINSNSSSKESSLTLDESVMNSFENLETNLKPQGLNQNQDKNKNKNKNNKAMPATHQPKRKNKKRRFGEIESIGGIPEENETEENDMSFDKEPPAKKAKTMKPALEKFYATTPMKQNKNKKSKK